jgi:hypothetical protein
MTEYYGSSRSLNGVEFSRFRACFAGQADPAYPDNPTVFEFIRHHGTKGASRGAGDSDIFFVYISLTYKTRFHMNITLMISYRIQSNC